MDAPIYKRSNGELVHDLREWPIEKPRGVYDIRCGIREQLFEPVNETAKRIIHIRQTHGEHAYCPKSPWLEQHDRFFLPPMFEFAGSVDKVIVPRTADMPWASSLHPPRYRVTQSLNFGYLQQFWEGSTVNHMGWPLPEWGLKPDNEDAEKVVEYFERNKRLKHRGLLAAPFDVLSGEVFLPELEDVREAA
jgi:hypothetical protein